jgi:hypothetical protein
MFSGRLSMRPTILPSKVVKVGADYLVVPTMIDYGATTGYSLPLYAAGNDEELYFSEYIAGRWDGASNITVSVIGYLGAAEDANDDFKLQLSWANKSTASGIFPATTTDVEVDTNIVDARKAKYSIYKVEFTIDWDADMSESISTSYAEEPSQHKCAHVIELTDGYFCAYPNNRILWAEPSMVSEPFKKIPDYRLNMRKYHCESHDNWATSDDDNYFYKINNYITNIK